MHVEHAIMKHQISDMWSDILTWRCGIMWTCILLSDMQDELTNMQFDNVLFSFFWLHYDFVFQKPALLFGSVSFESRQNQ